MKMTLEEEILFTLVLHHPTTQTLQRPRWRNLPLVPVMEHSDPTTMTWFIVAVIVAVLMLLAVLFSVWVYNKRLSRVSELRAQLYEGYEPPPVVEKEKKAPDVEAAIQENEVDEAAITAEKQRQ
ncbi:hypothetical protein Avbf_07090 [Armadillidium vulgare]|nr:hypothetical protein Avbf_07090 [Armadillidium vulgare]